jgi:hypothetical protein
LSSVPIPKADLQRALVRKFAFEAVPGSKHEAHTLKVDGKKVATTRFSRGLRSEDLGPALLRQIALQLRLDSEPLKKICGMVECSVSQEDYLRELRDAGVLG